MRSCCSLYAIALVFCSPRPRQYFPDETMESSIYGGTELDTLAALDDYAA